MRFLVGPVLALGLWGGACSELPGPPGPGEAPWSIVLVNLSGLRADAVGPGDEGVSYAPFLRALADEASSYDGAFGVSSDPLAAQVSLLSGLYPQEHGVTAPRLALTADAPVLAERFADFGYRTAAFTTGGYATSDFGIDRGFEFFEVVDDGTRGVFEAALEHLGEIEEERFLLYLQANVFESSVARLHAGFDELTPDTVEEVRRTYETGVRVADDALESLIEGLGAVGLAERTIVLVTADRAFELGEHGHVGYLQVYPESLAVPLVVRVPGRAASRSADLAQTVDVAATLYHLASLPAPPASGFLLPGFEGAPGRRTWAAAQRRGRWAQESLIVAGSAGSAGSEGPEGRRQLVVSRLRGEYDGTWVTRGIVFDTDEPVLEFRAVSYRIPRTVSVRVDGRERAAIELGSDWRKVRIELAEEAGESRRRRVELAAESCESPGDHGSSVDRRCLSFKVDGLDFERLEVFDLRSDPGARRDLSFEKPDLLADLVHRLDRHAWLEVASPDATTAGSPSLERVAAMGEIPEPPGP